MNTSIVEEDYMPYYTGISTGFVDCGLAGDGVLIWTGVVLPAGFMIGSSSLTFAPSASRLPKQVEQSPPIKCCTRNRYSMCTNFEIGGLAQSTLGERWNNVIARGIQWMQIAILVITKLTNNLHNSIFDIKIWKGDQQKLIKKNRNRSTTCNKGFAVRYIK